MEHNNTGDEMIEIIPDVVPEEDHDIKISDPQADIQEDLDIKIADPKEETPKDPDIVTPAASDTSVEDDFSEELEEIDQ